MYFVHGDYEVLIMVRPTYREAFSDCGCMLVIRDVQHFPDGRCLVDAVGGRRFKVLSRSMRNGYHTANVEFLKDRIEQDEEQIEGGFTTPAIWYSLTLWLD